jgi:transposase
MNFPPSCPPRLRSGFTLPPPRRTRHSVMTRQEPHLSLAGNCSDDLSQLSALLGVLSAEEAIPTVAKAMFEQMGQHIADLDLKIDALERQLLEQHKANAVSKLLAAIPGVGPITAMTMALTVNPASFESGRHFAAWIGLTPREHSTGGKHRLGRISKAGSERLRQLLVVGAMAVIRYAKPGSKSATA